MSSVSETCVMHNTCPKRALREQSHQALDITHCIYWKKIWATRLCHETCSWYNNVQARCRYVTLIALRFFFSSTCSRNLMSGVFQRFMWKLNLWTVFTDPGPYVHPLCRLSCKQGFQDNLYMLDFCNLRVSLRQWCEPKFACHRPLGKK